MLRAIKSNNIGKDIHYIQDTIYADSKQFLDGEQQYKSTQERVAFAFKWMRMLQSMCKISGNSVTINLL